MQFDVSRKKYFSKVNDYLFSNTGKELLIKSDSEVHSKKFVVQVINLSNGKTDTIWRGKSANCFVFDQAETKIAFMAEDPVRSEEDAIWYYQDDMDSALCLINSHTNGLELGWAFRNTRLNFSSKGDKLFFKIYKKGCGH